MAGLTVSDFEMGHCWVRWMEYRWELAMACCSVANLSVVPSWESETVSCSVAGSPMALSWAPMREPEIYLALMTGSARVWSSVGSRDGEILKVLR